MTQFRPMSGEDSCRDLGTKMDVYLDGVKQDHILFYDCDQGIVRRRAVDASGNIIFDEKKGHFNQILFGHVTEAPKSE